jgi:hypothetical protein
MPQNQETGARANAWGHEASRNIAKQIGAVSVSATSNEFRYKDKLVTIRCAKKTTTIVGVTYSMMERIESIIGAFENSDGTFQLYEISPQIFKMNMRDSKNENKVGVVRKKVFQDFGTKVPTEFK